MVNELGVTTTGSLKETVTFRSTATSLALFAGNGRRDGRRGVGRDGPPRCCAARVCRLRSSRLSSLSAQPSPARRSAVVFDGAGRRRGASNTDAVLP